MRTPATFFFIIAICASLALGASGSLAEEARRDTLRESLLPNSRASDADSVSSASRPVSPTTDADVWSRIRNGFRMPALDTPRVDSQLELFTRHPQTFAKTAERAGMYLYHIVGEIEERGMPMELALLPFVESAFRPDVVSSAKASGLWQFIPSTGTHFDLQQNQWQDERRDVIESTRAALDYFQKLYDQFGDWHLALASYNWGEGNVQKALDRNERNGLPADYLNIRMPAETANYVPRLEAVKRIISRPADYGIELPDIGSEPYFVKVFRDKDIDTRTAAKLAGMKFEEFKMLNPGLNRPVIVGAHENAMLIPADNVDEFIENLIQWRSNGKRLSSWKLRRLMPGESLTDLAEDSGMTVEEIRRINRIPHNRKVAPDSMLLVKAAQDEPSEQLEGRNTSFRLEPLPSVPKIRYRQIRYRVRKGDTLASIAQRLHVTTRSIVVSNHLRRPQVSRNMELLITVPVINRAQSYARISAEKAAYQQRAQLRLQAGRALPKKKAAPVSGKKSAVRSKPQAKGQAARHGGKFAAVPAARRTAAARVPATPKRKK